MADVYGELTSYVVFPTESDHHGSSATGTGRIATELYYSRIADFAAGRGNYIISGFTLQASGSRVDAKIYSGSALINGHYIVGNQDISVTYNDGVTTYVYLKLEYTGDLVNRPLIELNETGTIPGNSAFIGKVVTSGGNITSIKAWKSGPRVVYGRSDYDSVTGGASRGNRSWTVSVESDYQRIDFDSGTFVNHPVLIIEPIYDSGFTLYPTIYEVKTGSTPDSVLIKGYKWNGSTFEAGYTNSAFSFIACG